MNAESEESIEFAKDVQRREALRQLEALAQEMWARNADLTPEEVEQLADEISRETIQRMVDEGKIVFRDVGTLSVVEAIELLMPQAGEDNLNR
jgi:hypothetical protein